jgi:hypothetical protein
MRGAVFAAGVAVALLAGCDSGSGSEYVGKWLDIKSDKRMLGIDHNGDNFVIWYTEPSIRDGQIETKYFPATIKEGTLQVRMEGFDAMTIIVDKVTGKLTDGSHDYRRPVQAGR